MTTAGVVTEYQIPIANAAPTDITLGPDMRLWFTELGVTRIGAIAKGGVGTEDPSPTTNARVGTSAIGS
jgi:virginiamycin B lyase